MTDPIKPTTFVLDVTAANGVPFRAVAVAAGAEGPNPARTKGSEHALVEFYDRRYEHTEHGQFTASYRIEDFASNGTNPRGAFCLVGHVADWTLDVDTYGLVLRWVVMLGLDKPRPAVRMAAERVKEAGALTRHWFRSAESLLVEPAGDSWQVGAVYADAHQVNGSTVKYALWSVAEDPEGWDFPTVNEVNAMIAAALTDDHTIAKPVNGGGYWLVKL